MPAISHIRGAGGAMRKLTERDLDAQIASNRERFADHFDAHERRLDAARERAARPSVIPLDSSLLARAARWVRNLFLNLRSPL